MNEIKDIQVTDLRNQFLETAKAAGFEVKENAIVGNNGYALGAKYKCTGLDTKTHIIEGTDKTIVYVAVTTEENVDISLKSVMGLSSLSGYYTTGEFVHEYGTTRKDGVLQKLTRIIKPEVVDGFSEDQMFQPKCRHFLDYLDICNKENPFKGKTLRYLGTVAKPYIASKPGRIPNDLCEVGWSRVLTAKLWQLV